MLLLRGEIPLFRKERELNYHQGERKSKIKFNLSLSNHGQVFRFHSIKGSCLKLIIRIHYYREASLKEAKGGYRN